MVFKWTINLRIDDGPIDDDHKKLMDLANRVLEMDRPNRDAEDLKQVIKELYDYVKNHFNREEGLMRKLKYPAVEAHHKKHEAIIQDMNHYITSSRHMAEMLSNFRALMSKWVIHHILEEDKKFQVFMDSKVQEFLKKD